MPTKGESAWNRLLKSIALSRVSAAMTHVTPQCGAPPIHGACDAMELPCHTWSIGAVT